MRLVRKVMGVSLSKREGYATKFIARSSKFWIFLPPYEPDDPLLHVYQLFDENEFYIGSVSAVVERWSGDGNYRGYIDDFVRAAREFKKLLDAQEAEGEQLKGLATDSKWALDIETGLRALRLSDRFNLIDWPDRDGPERDARFYIEVFRGDKHGPLYWPITWSRPRYIPKYVWNAAQKQAALEREAQAGNEQLKNFTTRRRLWEF